MTVTETLGRKVLAGGQLTKKEAMTLYGQPLEELCTMADTVRARFHAQAFSLCTIVNGKSGRCTENCRFCAQSAHYHTEAAVYPLCDQEEILAQAKRWQAQGVPRFGIVTAGRRLSGREVEEMCRTIRRVRRETEISLCVSFGLLREEEYRALKEAGVERVHNNLETSRCYFPQVCTTHTFEDKLTAIRAAQAAGLTVCSGGIVGMGETPEDRIDMALTLRELGISSVPLNLLQGIPAGEAIAGGTAPHCGGIPSGAAGRGDPPGRRPGAAVGPGKGLFSIRGKRGDLWGHADHRGDYCGDGPKPAGRTGIRGEVRPWRRNCLSQGQGPMWEKPT